MDKGEMIKKWYESYNSPPPWSSVVGFVIREIKKAKKEERDRIAKWVERNWSNYYDSSKPLADFRKQLLIMTKIENKVENRLEELELEKLENENNS